MSFLVCSALIRVTPEAMTKLLRLPEGNRVLRFQLIAGVLHCLASGPLMPECCGGDLEILTPEDIAERKRAAVAAASNE